MNVNPMVVDLSHERLLKLLHYNPDNGEFTWLLTRGRWAKAGDRAGNENKSRVHASYRQIMIDSRNYRAARLAWFYMTGEWPYPEIDHRNRNPLDDSWNNLRLATSSQNKVNQKKRSDNKTGFKGVHRHHRKFYARARIDGVYKYLGMFDTPEDAAEYYKIVTSSVHGEFAPW